MLGVELRAGTRLQARGGKPISIMSSLIDLRSKQHCSPIALAAFVGQLQWQCMLARPSFSSFEAVSGLTKLQPDKLVQPLYDGIVSELALCTSLFALRSVDLSRPWWPVVAATDASSSFGFDMPIARCSQALSRATVAANGSTNCVVRLQHHEEDPAELPRTGDVYRLPLDMYSFKTVFSIRATHKAHSGALAIQAVRLALLRLTRSSRPHGHRGVVLVVAKVVGSALLKGRSSLYTIKRGCRASSEVQLAAVLKLVFHCQVSQTRPIIPAGSSPRGGV